MLVEDWWTFFVRRQKQKDVFETVCRIPMITSAKEEQKMIATCRKVNHILSQTKVHSRWAAEIYVGSSFCVYTQLLRFIPVFFVSTAGSKIAEQQRKQQVLLHQVKTKARCVLERVWEASNKLCVSQVASLFSSIYLDFKCKVLIDLLSC